MKLSHYAHVIGVSYKTVYRWWKTGRLSTRVYQLPTGTIVIEPPPVQSAQASSTPVLTTERTVVNLYTRVNSNDQKADVYRQLVRLREYASSKGYTIEREVVEIASGLNDTRPRLSRLLADSTVGVIVVEHRDRLTRFDFNYIHILLEAQGRRVEVVEEKDTDNELVDDFVAVITSMAARIYGQRNSRRRARAKAKGENVASTKDTEGGSQQVRG